MRATPGDFAVTAGAPGWPFGRPGFRPLFFRSDRGDGFPRPLPQLSGLPPATLPVPC
jgi:hypothetical protein